MTLSIRNFKKITIMSLIFCFLVFNLFTIMFSNNSNFPKKAISNLLKTENNSTVFSDFGWNLNWSINIDVIEKWDIEIGSFSDNINSDIVCGLDNGTVKIFNKNKLNQSIILENNHSTDISLADIDADSQNELITANLNNISIFDYNTGINSSILLSENISVFLADDFLEENTGPVKIEIIVGDSAGNLTVWQINPDDGQFQLLESFLFPGYIISDILIDDFISDSKLDLALITNSGNMTIFAWDRDNNLYKFHTTQINAGFGPFILDIIDINNDYISEFAIADSFRNLSIWRWDPYVGYVLYSKEKLNSQILSLESKDINNDEHNELLVGTESGNISVWGIANGEFGMYGSNLVKHNITAISAGDLDGNNIMEITVGSEYNLSVFEIYLPDLNILSFEIDRTSIIRGESFVVTVNITNIGDYPAKNVLIGIFWDTISYDYKLGGFKTISILEIANSTEFSLTIPTDKRNINEHTLIARLNYKNSMLEKDMVANQEKSLEIKIISFDWIWMVVIMSAIFTGVLLTIYLFPKYKEKEDEDEKRKKSTVKKRLKYKRKK